MKLIRIISPVRDASRLDDARWRVVNSKFKSHQAVAEMICLAGLFAGMLLPMIISPPMQVWDIGLAFGALGCFPLIYIIAVCWKGGFRDSWRDFADFSTMKYAMPWNTQLGIFLLFGLAGLVSVVGRIFYPLSIN